MLVVCLMPEVHPDIEEHEDKKHFNDGNRPKRDQRAGLRPCNRADSQAAKRKSRQQAVHDRGQDMRQPVAQSCHAVLVMGEHAFEHEDRDKCYGYKKRFYVHARAFEIEMLVTLCVEHSRLIQESQMDGRDQLG